MIRQAVKPKLSLQLRSRSSPTRLIPHRPKVGTGSGTTFQHQIPESVKTIHASGIRKSFGPFDHVSTCRVFHSRLAYNLRLIMDITANGKKQVFSLSFSIFLRVLYHSERWQVIKYGSFDLGPSSRWPALIRPNYLDDV